MRIGIDTRTLSYRRGGITQYTYYLLKNLLILDKENTYYLFNYCKSHILWNNLGANFREVVVRFPQRSFCKPVWQELLLPYFAKQHKIDLMFSPDFYLSPWINTRKVITIHDMMFAAFNTVRNEKESKKKFNEVIQGVRHCDHIIVPSEYSKSDAIKYLPIDNNRISVIHEGVDEKFHIIDYTTCRKVLGKYNIPDRFILFVGELNRRKNLHKSIAAFSYLKEKDKLRDIHLIIIGKKTKDTDDILNQMDKSIFEDCHFLGYIADEDLPFFYNQALAFLFLSSFEGFGLPLLEAMACGSPVICSNRTSIPEIAGDAGLSVNPDDQDEICRAILNVIDNSVLRKSLIEKGLQRASKFSWYKAAKETLSLFKTLIHD